MSQDDLTITTDNGACKICGNCAMFHQPWTGYGETYCTLSGNSVRRIPVDKHRPACAFFTPATTSPNL